MNVLTVRIRIRLVLEHAERPEFALAIAVERAFRPGGAHVVRVPGLEPGLGERVEGFHAGLAQVHRRFPGGRLRRRFRGRLRVRVGEDARRDPASVLAESGPARGRRAVVRGHALRLLRQDAREGDEPVAVGPHAVAVGEQAEGVGAIDAPVEPGPGLDASFEAGVAPELAAGVGGRVPRHAAAEHEDHRHAGEKRKDGRLRDLEPGLHVPSHVPNRTRLRSAEAVNAQPSRSPHAARSARVTAGRPQPDAAMRQNPDREQVWNRGTNPRALALTAREPASRRCRRGFRRAARRRSVSSACPSRRRPAGKWSMTDKRASNRSTIHGQSRVSPLGALTPPPSLRPRRASDGVSFPPEARMSPATSGAAAFRIVSFAGLSTRASVGTRIRVGRASASASAEASGLAGARCSFAAIRSPSATVRREPRARAVVHSKPCPMLQAQLT